MVIYLDMEPEVSQRLMERSMIGIRFRRIFTSAICIIWSVRMSRPGFAGRKLGWTGVQCVIGGMMRTVEDIHQEIVDRIREYLSGAQE